MRPSQILEELQARGYTTAVKDGRLKLRGPCRPPAELERRISDCRDELIKLLEHPLDCPCIDCSATGPKYAKPIESAGEVLEMARARFNLDPADREPPVPAPPRGRDSFAKHGTDRARFFRGDWRQAWPQDFNPGGAS
jgi:hypothetical protein